MESQDLTKLPYPCQFTKVWLFDWNRVRVPLRMDPNIFSSRSLFPEIYLLLFSSKPEVFFKRKIKVMGFIWSSRLWECSFSSVQSLSLVWLFETPWTAACQASVSVTNSGVYSNSCPLSQWCHPTISRSVVSFSCPQSFPASRSFQMSQLFASGSQSTGVSASTSVLPMNTQDWSPLERIGWISLQSKGLSRVFSNTTVQKHQFFGAQLSL